jgi:hypothetical protein
MMPTAARCGIRTGIEVIPMMITEILQMIGVGGMEVGGVGDVEAEVAPYRPCLDEFLVLGE